MNAAECMRTDVAGVLCALAEPVELEWLLELTTTTREASRVHHACHGLQKRRLVYFDPNGTWRWMGESMGNDERLARLNEYIHRAATHELRLMIRRQIRDLENEQVAA